jgi:hypothetical protein
LSSVVVSGETAAVYNVRVAEDHTYFVGARSWGFSVWSHNSECQRLFDFMKAPALPSESVSPRVFEGGGETSTGAAANLQQAVEAAVGGAPALPTPEHQSMLFADMEAERLAALAPGGEVYSVRIDSGVPGRPDPRYSIDTLTFSGGEATSRGGIRNTQEFWEQWARLRPETLDASNRFLIENYSSLKVSPRVNEQWVQSFPEHAPYMSDTLIHHHERFGRYAIPVPPSTHVGSGGTWDVE